MLTPAAPSSVAQRRSRADVLAPALALATALMAGQAAATPTADQGQDDAPLALHAQSTYVWQRKPSFAAAYTGPNSLVPGRERSYSFTATADLALRAWDGAQIHFNPEAAQGVPLSHLAGAGGLSNGELARSSGAQPKAYRARLFLLQRWNAGGEAERIDPDFNEMGGTATANRWTLVAGNLSLLDYFDPKLRTCTKSFRGSRWSAIGMSGDFGCAAWARAHASSRSLQSPDFTPTLRASPLPGGLRRCGAGQ